MNTGARLHLFALCLAAACGWLLGLVLLPLAVWAALEVVFVATDAVRHRPPPAQRPAAS
jgi:hypothetical protein